MKAAAVSVLAVILLAVSVIAEAQPVGNITGLTILAPELTGKRLELLKEPSQRSAESPSSMVPP
jgi:hypothetical protein